MPRAGRRTICVYALAQRASGRLGVRGVSGERLQVVRVGAIDAVIGRVSRIPRPTEHNLRRHGRIISALWRRTPALLPARFGTSVADVGELELIIGTRDKSLRRHLRSVSNRAQMTVRIVSGSGARDSGLGARDSGLGARDSGLWARDSGLGKAVNPSSISGSRIPGRESRVPSPESRGRSYLHARFADAQREREVPGFRPFRDVVKTWVRAERVEKRGSVATIYHLVPRGSADRYRAALERAAGAANVRMLVSGPWPPYAFADGW